VTENISILAGILFFLLAGGSVLLGMKVELLIYRSLRKGINLVFWVSTVGMLLLPEGAVRIALSRDTGFAEDVLLYITGALLLGVWAGLLAIRRGQVIALKDYEMQRQIELDQIRIELAQKLPDSDRRNHSGLRD